MIYLDPNAGDIVGRQSDDLDVLWVDVYLSLLHRRDLTDLEDDPGSAWHGPYKEMLNELRELLATDAERKFFDLYVEMCSEEYEDLRDAPALIPQVWVNWIHYDPKSRERAERVQSEAFRVDFVLRTNETGGFVVIEIDGSSHFGGRSFISDNGKLTFEASMEAYTKHLRKDRWLRKQGWRVIRLSNAEVEEVNGIKQYRSLLADVLDSQTLGTMRLKSSWF